jgi:hypothetical protein
MDGMHNDSGITFVIFEDKDIEIIIKIENGGDLLFNNVRFINSTTNFFSN